MDGDFNENRLEHISIKVNGADLERELMDALAEVVVDLSLHLPDMFIIRVHDDSLRWLDEGPFEPGASVEIAMARPGRERQKVLSGEVTAIEPDFDEGNLATLTVRGYDRSHRLHRGTKTRVFVQATDSDIVSRIAVEAGLRADCERTTEIYSHVFQHNQTDMDFLRNRAERLGFEVYVDDQTLVFRPPRGQAGTVRLEWGRELRSFHPRLSLTDQVDEVVVKGWDPESKQEIVGTASLSDTAPQIGIEGYGGRVAAGAFQSARQVVVRQPVSSQTEADIRAQAILDEINSGFVEAEGHAAGTPDLRPGVTVELVGLGDKFSGRYVVTAAQHVYSAQGGYSTHFTVEGAHPTLLADLILPHEEQKPIWTGVVPAIVTNNNDPDNWGRVKLRYPWLDGNVESDWARVASIGAGAERGIFWLPEINDEVLVAFEHGDFNRPYVIGGLWNGQDAPPEGISQAVANGKVQTRTIRTRTGHIIRLVDNENGDQYIEIVDAAEGTHIKLDARNKKLSIVCKGDVEITSDGSLTLKASRDMKLEAGGKLAVKGRELDIRSDTSADLKTNGSLKLEGATFSAQGSGTAELKAGATLTIQGALVKIN